MATFKVGDRVRVVAVDGTATDALIVPIGAEGVVMDAGGDWCWQYGVELPGHMPSRGGLWGFNAEHLAPLTDRGADAFMERLRNLGREPNMPQVRIGDSFNLPIPNEIVTRGLP
jgi:hypothetical protein